MLAVVVIHAAASTAAAFQETAAGQPSEYAVDRPRQSAAADSAAGDQTRQAGEAAAGAGTVDSLLNPQPKNEFLYHIGPALQEGEPHGAESRAAGQAHRASTQNIEAENGPSAESNHIEDEFAPAQDDWIQMDIDQEGTYLFFGESDDADEKLMNPTEMRGLIDSGLGIGKKWHF